VDSIDKGIGTVVSTALQRGRQAARAGGDQAQNWAQGGRINGFGVAGTRTTGRSGGALVKRRVRRFGADGTTTVTGGGLTGAGQIAAGTAATGVVGGGTYAGLRNRDEVGKAWDGLVIFGKASELSLKDMQGKVGYNMDAPKGARIRTATDASREAALFSRKGKNRKGNWQTYGRNIGVGTGIGAAAGLAAGAALKHPAQGLALGAGTGAVGGEFAGSSKIQRRAMTRAFNGAIDRGDMRTTGPGETVGLSGSVRRKKKLKVSAKVVDADIEKAWDGLEIFGKVSAREAFGATALTGAALGGVGGGAYYTGRNRGKSAARRKPHQRARLKRIAEGKESSDKLVGGVIGGLVGNVPGAVAGGAYGAGFDSGVRQAAGKRKKD
jgi:hypothetical protein